MFFLTGWFLLVIALIACLMWRAAWKKDEGADRFGKQRPVILPSVFAAVAVLSLFLFTVFSIIKVVPPGTVYNGIWFGAVQQRPFEQGLNLVNPMLNFTDNSVRRQIVEFQSGGDPNNENSEQVVSLSKDNLPLDIDVAFAYRLNPKWAWWIYQNVGTENVYRQTLIVQAARNASRDAVASFTSDEATTTNREGLAREMGRLFEERIVEDMVRQGLSEEDARQVFTILPVQLRKVLPPLKVLNAISEKEAAKQDLQRQETLTSIAKEVANRRSNEGLGVARLFGELPAEFTPGQISTVLGALANKTRADALLKAVETGQVKVIVVPDGNAVAISSPTP